MTTPQARPTADLQALIVNTLESLKAQDIVVLDVKGKANFTDVMIIASGSSDRHLKTMANEIHVQTKAAGSPPLSIEGEDSRNWILVDLGDIVVHLMRPQTREMYEIEKLWRIASPKRAEGTG